VRLRQKEAAARLKPPLLQPWRRNGETEEHVVEVPGSDNGSWTPGRKGMGSISLLERRERKLGIEEIGGADGCIVRE
jgi:hypothetical protein